MSTVADFLVRALVEQDLRTLYCLPGIQLDPFFNALKKGSSWMPGRQ
jgi:thiamine pyrophosphate-dependent acetolactate synthase large subunit-like protein